MIPLPGAIKILQLRSHKLCSAAKKLKNQPTNKLFSIPTIDYLLIILFDGYHKTPICKKCNICEAQ